MNETTKTEVEIQPRNAARFELEAGDLLRIESPEGGQGGDMSFLGFDQSVTRNATGWERFGKPWLVYTADPGTKLYDGDAKAMMSVEEKRGAGDNDIMYPGCWAEIYPDRRPGCRDLVSAALGIDRTELRGMLSFMVGAEACEDGYHGLAHTVVEPGDFVSFRALEPLVAAVSACPDDELPGWRAAPLRVTVEAGA